MKPNRKHYAALVAKIESSRRDHINMLRVIEDQTRRAGRAEQRLKQFISTRVSERFDHPDQFEMCLRVDGKALQRCPDREAFARSAANQLVAELMTKIKP